MDGTIMKHEKRAVIMVSSSGDGKWLLFEKTISPSVAQSIMIAQKEYEDTWHNLRALGFRLIRLNVKDDKPCDLMFEYGNEHPSVNDIPGYSFKLLTTGKVKDETDSSEDSN